MSTPIRYSHTLIAAVKAIVLAAAINAGLFFAFFALKLVDPHVPVSPDGQGMNIGMVVFVTLAWMVAGTLVFLLLLRFSNQPVRIFSWICLLVALLSMGNPFIAGMPTTMALAVDFLHVPPAYLLWRFLTRSVALTF